MKVLFPILFLTFSSLGLFAQDNEDPGLRLDPLWTSQSSSNGFWTPRLAIDAEGNLYSGGTYQNYLRTADTTYSQPPQTFRERFANSIFMQGHSTSGELKWTTYVEGQGRMHAIEVDEEGNSYYSGLFWSSTLVVVSPNGSRDSLRMKGFNKSGIYVIKLDREGNYLNSGYFGLDRNDEANKLVLDSKGNIYVGGVYLYRKENELIRSFLLLKFDPELNLEWLMDGDTVGMSQITALQVDGSDNLYVGGVYKQNLSLGSMGLNSEDEKRWPFIAKLRSNGEVKWISKTIADKEGAYFDLSVSAIQLDFWRNIYVAGGSQSRAFVSRLSRKGKFKWSNQSYGRSNYSFGLIKNSDSKNLIHFGHGYGGKFSFQAGDTIEYKTVGSTDIFIHEETRKGRHILSLVGGGEGTDYVTDLRYHDGYLYVIGNDLGGRKIKFKEKEILPPDYRANFPVKPSVWIACFKWVE